MKHTWIFLVLTLLGFTHLCYAPQQTIASSGLYTLGGNITYSPVSSDDIILISANDVILDLGGYIISQGNLTAGVNGIEVSAGVSNVTIQNGTIRNLTGRGILVNQNCLNIYISNVLTYSCDTCGISLTGATSPNEIKASAIDSCKILFCGRNPASTCALGLDFCLRTRVTNCLVNTNGDTTHTFTAVRLNNCGRCRLDNVEINSNRGSTSISGLGLTTVTDSIFNNCVTKNNLVTSSNANLTAFSIATNNTGNLFTNCIAQGNYAGTTGSNIQAFTVLSTSDDNVFQNCFCLSNSGANTVTTFSVGGNRNYFDTCIAHDGQSSSGMVVGFDIGFTFSCVLKNCLINEHIASIGSATGLRLISCTDCVVENCIIANNAAFNDSTGVKNVSGSQNTFINNLCTLTQGGNAAITFGYVLINDKNSPYIQNMAIRNGSTNANQYSGFNAGQNDVQASSSVNSISEPWTNAGLV